MGIFGGTSPADTEVENATSEKNESEKWDLILDICDKAGKSSDEAKNYLKAILKRLNHSDPHVALQAAILLDACVNNSGKTFHIEIASREFENEFLKLINKSHTKVKQKLKESLKKWSEAEFKSDQQLNLIPTLYNKLKREGHDFSAADMPASRTVSLSKDPNVVQSQEEEDQIVKAIELSLKETSGSGSPRTSSSLYPSTNLALSNLPSTIPPKEPRKVRALYDFEAAEDNELTFSTGEIIFVLDDSDQNWWKGSNQRGEGLFPANFVTADLTIEPEQFLYEKAKKAVQFKEEIKAETKQKEPEEVEINEEKIDRLLYLLHEADPTNPEHDTDEMLNLEREVNLMGPLIDTELERVDRKHAQLTQLSSDLVDALGLYHSLMREPQFPTINKVPYNFPQPHPSNMPPHPHLTQRPYMNDARMYQPPQFPMPGQQMHHMGPPPMGMPSSSQGLPLPGPHIPQPPPGLNQQQAQDDRRAHQDPSLPHFPSGFSQSIPGPYPQVGGPVGLQHMPQGPPGTHFQPA